MYLELLLTLTVLTIQGQRPGSIEENATPKVPMEVCDAGENCKKGRYAFFSIYSKDKSAISDLALTSLLSKTHFCLGLTLLTAGLVYSLCVCSEHYGDPGRKLEMDP